jgi:carbon storage regulator CsrA
MLVLTRKISQQINIGKNIKVTILGIKGKAVRIGIEAPHEVKVLRGELPEFEDGKTELQIDSHIAPLAKLASQASRRRLATEERLPMPPRGRDVRMDGASFRPEACERLPGLVSCVADVIGG